LAAAHGETLAAHGCRSDSLRAFDCAAALLPQGDTTTERPYVAPGAVHLARWRGHALACFGDVDAVDVLTDALDKLNSSFARADTSLRPGYRARSTRRTRRITTWSDNHPLPPWSDNHPLKAPD